MTHKGVDDTLEALSEQALRGAKHEQIVSWAESHSGKPAAMLKEIQTIPFSSEYTNEPPSVEDVLSGAACDADERCTLFAAALVASGHSCRIVAHAYKGEAFTNALVEVLVRGEWLPAETGMEILLGELAAQPTAVRRGPILRMCTACGAAFRGTSYTNEHNGRLLCGPCWIALAPTDDERETRQGLTKINFCEVFDQPEHE